MTVALSICEDIWFETTIQQARKENACLMINISALPFINTSNNNIDLLSERAKQGHMPILYVNQVGGQDELVFDGGCFAVSQEGEHIAQASFFTEESLVIRVQQINNICSLVDQALPEPEPTIALLYQTLVLGLRIDYVNKNKFSRSFLISGGIDSALTLTIAVDALGSERVSAFMMPFTYTSTLSREDAADQAQRLGVDYQVIGLGCCLQEVGNAR